jgi:hypothetical protein
VLSDLFTCSIRYWDLVLVSVVCASDTVILFKVCLQKEVQGACKVTSPMIITIRILHCSKCGTILQTFFSNKT